MIKNSIPVLGIPHYNRPDLTARCIASIDYPVTNLVLVLNNEKVNPDDFDEFGDVAIRNKQIEKVTLIHHPNAGVAGAWNEIIKLFPAPWWLISNNDIQFAPGDLQKMAEATWLEEFRNGIFYGNHGASWFSITSNCVETVGLFDENIHPAYLEDCDYAYRCDLLKIRRTNVQDVHALHGDEKLTGSCTINSDPAVARANQMTHGRNFEYYRLKWGGVNGEEKFKTPFNDYRCPVWAWKFDPKFRAEQLWVEPRLGK